MADFMEVGQNTISTWINGHHRPSPQAIRLWAMKTGVSYEWLRGDPKRRAGALAGAAAGAEVRRRESWNWELAA